MEMERYKTKQNKLVFTSLLIILILMSTVFAVKTFHIQETDLVKIVPDTFDPDNDNVTYYYSEPLDKNGEWQTGYDDAGEYEIEITASDGMERTTEKVNLIIDNLNRAPSIDENRLSIKENQVLDLKNFISDPDNDILTYVFNKPFNKDGVWKPSYNDAGIIVTNVQVSDGQSTIDGQIEIKVLDTNQPPIITESFFLGKIYQLKENQTLDFYVDVLDNDNDPMTYLWTLDDDLIIGDEKLGEYYFDFSSSGEHTLKLVVSDGIKEIEKSWVIKVDNVNRKPLLDFLPVVFNENEKVYLDLPDLDQDGDELIYSFTEPLDKEGEWQTNYNDAGTYEVKVTASDGEFIAKGTIIITILDVDRPPKLFLPEQLEVSEGEKLLWKIDSYDLDGDKVNVEVMGLPETARYDSDKQELTWFPDYDTIKRKGGLLSNILNALRLEHFIIKTRKFPLEIKSCGKDLCSSGKVNILVHNINRGPVLEKIANITIQETETITLKAVAKDPDNDIVRYAYSEPLSKFSGKLKTGYDDEATYVVYVSATDGKLTDTQPVTLTITKKNRAPSLKIKNDQIVVNEGEKFSVPVIVTDPDGDLVNLSLSNLPSGASFKDATFTWTPGYDVVNNRTFKFRNNFKSSFFNRKFSDDKEVFWLEFVAINGEFEVNHPLKVIVKNVNQAPELIDNLPSENELTVLVDREIPFQVLARDFDGDKLTYHWEFGLGEGNVEGTNTITRTFTTPGKKKVKVTISDGMYEVVKEWKVDVVTPNVKLVDSLPVSEPSTEPFGVKVYVIET